MYNTTKNAKTCESSFKVESAVSIVPIKVVTNSTTNLTIYTNDDSADLRTVAVNFSNILP